MLGGEAAEGGADDEDGEAGAEYPAPAVDVADPAEGRYHDCRHGYVDKDYPDGDDKVREERVVDGRPD
jgi:hypothetical protein